MSDDSRTHNWHDSGLLGYAGGMVYVIGVGTMWAFGRIPFETTVLALLVLIAVELLDVRWRD